MSTLIKNVLASESGDTGQNNKIFSVLITIFGMIFLEFLIMGISLGVLPNYVHGSLGFNNLVVGVVIGLQYAATLCTRHFAGKMADSKGGRQAVITGILISSVSGIFCLFSQFLMAMPVASLSALIVGRILLGIGESYLVIGVFAWGFILVGPKNTGKVMVWNGMGMYGGMACGAPLGIFLQTQWSITTAFAALALLPAISFLAMLMLPVVQLPKQLARLPFYKAVNLVWKSGTGLAFASIGFAGIASFITLFFIQQSWQGASFAITAFGAGYVVVRIFFAGFPDKFGGARVAMVSLLIEIAGQLLIWSATSAVMGIVGAGLTGIGMSLVFPSFGTIAVKRVSAENRGMAMAAYNAFFDLGMGLTAPIAGLIAGQGHYSNIYMLGAVTAATSALLAYLEYKKDKTVYKNKNEAIIETI